MKTKKVKKQKMKKHNKRKVNSKKQSTYTNNVSNSNEKLTVDWVLNETKTDKPIFTNEVFKTLGIKGIKKVIKKLEPFGILTFTDFQNDLVVFIKNSNKNLSVSEMNGVRGGTYIVDENVMILPLTPLSI